MKFLNYIFRKMKPNANSDSIKENWHEDFIVHIARIIQPKVYVELGLYQCALFNRIIPYAQTLIGVDIAKEAGIHMQNTPKTRFVCATTKAFAQSLKQKPIQIDMLFIDADHSYESVKADFETFFPFIAPDGLIIMHDSYPKNKKYTKPGYCGDGFKAVWELSQRTKDYELVTIPVHPGITICRKRNKQLKWQQ